MDVANLWEMCVASIVSISPEDGDSMYLWNVGNIAHIHIV
jgi:hypothetical protein